jgi:hypothetical protein
VQYLGGVLLIYAKHLERIVARALDFSDIF